MLNTGNPFSFQLSGEILQNSMNRRLYKLGYLKIRKIAIFKLERSSNKLEDKAAADVVLFRENINPDD